MKHKASMCGRILCLESKARLTVLSHIKNCIPLYTVPKGCQIYFNMQVSLVSIKTNIRERKSIII